MRKFISVLLLTSILGACVQIPQTPSRAEPNYRPVWPAMAQPQPLSSGSLYNTSHNLALFNDRRAREVGDVVTITLEERMRSSKSAETTIGRDTSNQVLNPTIFGNLVQGNTPTDANNISSSTEFSGGGDSDQSNSLTGTISAVVADVMPNGLLLVQGEKWFQLNTGEEYVRVSGLVRPEDIASDNSVSSLRLADARVAYSGTGAIAQSNKAGWVTRFFLGPINPF